MKLLFAPPFRPHAAPNFLLVVAITVLGALATHVIIPALPAIAKDLHASPAMIQQTIVVYLVGLAAGQLIYGPLSDRFGRRPWVLAGLLLFVAACALAAFADSTGALLAARVLQALGACAGLVLGRAILRDSTANDRIASLMAVLLTVLVIGPALAPTIGGLVTTWLGWRAIFVLMGILGALSFVVCLLVLPETNRNRVPIPGIRPMLQSFARLLRLPAFRGNAIGGSCVTTSMYSFFAASPFIFFDVLDQSADRMGLYYLIIMGCVAVGSFVASRFARRFSANVLALAGSRVQIAGAALLLLADLSGVLSVATVVGPMMIVAAASGFGGPMAVAGAVSADPRAIGAASGLYGSMQMLFGAFCSLAVSLWHTDSVLPVAVILLASAIAGQFAFQHAGRHGHDGRRN